MYIYIYIYIMHVFQTTSDHLYFFRLKFGARYSMLQYKSVERIHSKEYCFMFSCTLLVFLLVFIIKLVLSFYFFIWRSIKFPPKNINQSETKIGDSQIDFIVFQCLGILTSTFLCTVIVFVWITLLLHWKELLHL